MLGMQWFLGYCIESRINRCLSRLGLIIRLAKFIWFVRVKNLIRFPCKNWIICSRWLTATASQAIKFRRSWTLLTINGTFCSALSLNIDDTLLLLIRCFRILVFFRFFILLFFLQPLLNFKVLFINFFETWTNLYIAWQNFV